MLNGVKATKELLNALDSVKKPPTNAGRIRSMSDEELAKFFGDKCTVRSTRRVYRKRVLTEEEKAERAERKRERNRETKRRSYQKHREEHLARQKQWQKEHREQLNAYSRE